MEIWKDIKGYEGYYQVSNMGNVRSLDRTFIDKRGGVKTIKGVLLKKHKTKCGYYFVRVSKNDISKNLIIHTLVFNAFDGRGRGGMVIDHIDNNRLNNCIDNLQLITQRENVSKGYLTKSKSSKYTGVYKNGNKWESKIRVNSKSRYLGLFNCETAASIAYQRELNLITGKE